MKNFTYHDRNTPEFIEIVKLIDKGVLDKTFVLSDVKLQIETITPFKLKEMAINRWLYRKKVNTYNGNNYIYQYTISEIAMNLCRQCELFV